MSERNRANRMLLSLLSALTCLACGLEQDITFDESEAVPPESHSVVVVWDGNEPEVFLNDLDKVLFQGSLVCRLWDILLAAGMKEQEILSMRFDFESQDGFRPSSKGCDLLEGETLESGGYLDTENLTLVWDLNLGLRGCYSVTQLALIIGAPA